MSTGLVALQKIAARLKGNPRYSMALSRPRRTNPGSTGEEPFFSWIQSPRSTNEVTRGQLRQLVEEKGQNVGTIREKFRGMPQQFDRWLVEGADDQILAPRVSDRDKLDQIIKWLEGL